MPTVTHVADSDTYIRNDQTSTNFSTQTILEIGNVSGKDSHRSNVIAEFDLTSSIPVGAHVSSAALVLDVETQPVGNLTIKVARTSEAFTLSQTTWVESKAGTSWATPGGTIDTKFEHTFTWFFDAPVGQATSSLTMGPMVNNAVNRHQRLLGVHLRSDDDDLGNWASIEHATIDPPELQVTYTVPKRYRTRGMRRSPANGQQNSHAGN